MGKTTRSQASSERQKWDKIFNLLLKMLKSQQDQLKTLVKERKIFEDRIRMQHEKWVSDVRLYEDYISQMKCDAVAQQMIRMLEAAKTNMVVGLKHREASLLKLKLEYTDDELADFRAWFDLLQQKSKDGELESIGSKIFEGEMRRLKLELDKLASVKKSEVSKLLAEKDFVWNQYRLMENDLTSKINSKRAEVDRANEKIEKLLAGMEQLQSSNSEKDESITRLKTKIAEMEAGSKKWNDEISRLTKELELLRKYASASATPVLNPCTARTTTSNAGGSIQNGTITAGIKGRLRNSGSSVSASATPVLNPWTAGATTCTGGSIQNGTITAGIQGRLRKSRSTSVTLLSNHCRTGTESLGGKNGSNVIMRKEELPATRVPDHVDNEKGTRSSKRKAVDVIPILDTPKLFSSKFKVPKLKNSSPLLNVR